MDPAASPSPLAVDLVVFTVTERDLKVLLVRRQAPAFGGAWCLPGDAVDLGDRGRQTGEHLLSAAVRVLETATGLEAQPSQLHQVATFGRAGRDPRGRIVTVVSLSCIRPDLSTLVSLRADADWFSVDEEVPWMRLSLDHAEILAAGVQRLQERLVNPAALMELVARSFTISELHGVETATLSLPTDARTFRRRFDRWVSAGIIDPAPGKRHLGRARPAKVWRAGCQVSGQSRVTSTG
jgi:8-oxo-dGTP diphosphatase